MFYGHHWPRGSWDRAGIVRARNRTWSLLFTLSLWAQMLVHMLRQFAFKLFSEKITHNALGFKTKSYCIHRNRTGGLNLIFVKQIFIIRRMIILTDFLARENQVLNDIPKRKIPTCSWNCVYFVAEVYQKDYLSHTKSRHWTAHSGNSKSLCILRKKLQSVFDGMIQECFQQV